jgi:hypothetical protein
MMDIFEKGDRLAELKLLFKKKIEFRRNPDLIHYAVLFKRTRMYRYLSKCGWKVNLARLMSLCIRERKPTMNDLHSMLYWFFVKYKFTTNVNAWCNGKTAVHYLLEYMTSKDTDFSAIRLLVKNGACFFCEDNKGFSPLFYALGKPVYQELKNSGFDFTQVHIYVQDRKVFDVVFDKNNKQNAAIPDTIVSRLINVIANLKINFDYWNREELKRIIVLRNGQTRDSLFHWLVKGKQVDYVIDLFRRLKNNYEVMGNEGLNKIRNVKERTCLFYVRDVEDYAKLIYYAHLDPYLRDYKGEIAIQKLYKRCRDYKSLRCFSEEYHRAFERLVGPSENFECMNRLHLKVIGKPFPPEDHSLNLTKFHNFRNFHGQTPLHLATDRKTQELLVRLGCDPDAMDIFGNKALDNSISSGVSSLFYLCTRVISYQTFRNMSDTVKWRASLYIPGDFFYETEIIKNSENSFLDFISSPEEKEFYFRLCDY